MQALKKHLTSLALSPGDVLIFKPPLGAPDRDFLPFCEEIHQETGYPVIVVRPGFTLERLSEESVEAAGMVRLFPAEDWPFSAPKDDPENLHLDLQALEDAAVERVRLAFAKVRERMG